jgi:hypothetical protein
MKKSIKLTALFVLASAGLFAATPSKGGGPAAAEISFSSLPSNKGVDIRVESAAPSKAIVTIYDANKNVIFKDAMPAYKSMEKGYILNELENGDYTIEVRENKQVVTKEVHIYNEDLTKVFLVKQS